MLSKQKEVSAIFFYVKTSQKCSLT